MENIDKDVQLATLKQENERLKVLLQAKIVGICQVCNERAEGIEPEIWLSQHKGCLVKRDARIRTEVYGQLYAAMVAGEDDVDLLKRLREPVDDFTSGSWPQDPLHLEAAERIDQLLRVGWFQQAMLDQWNRLGEKVSKRNLPKISVPEPKAPSLISRAYRRLAEFGDRLRTAAIF